jgi:hypothetical protein
LEWREAKPPKGEPGPIYNFRRGYEVAKAGRHESADQYAVFQQYLRMSGNRTFRELSDLAGVSSNTLGEWAKRYKWENRAARWDRDQLAITWKEADKLKRNAHREAIVEFRDSAERQARIMSRVSEDLIRVLGKRIAKAEEEGEEIPMHMVGGLMRAAASINEQSRQAWASSLGVNELLDVVETEIEKVRVEELESEDPYHIQIDE